MIELIVLDVDGTLTDGKIIYTNSGDELKAFDVADGLAIATWSKKLGKKVAIITGRTSKIVEKRASDLQIEYLYQNIHNKDEVLTEILKKEGLSWNQVAAIGDDLNDFKMLKKVGLSFTPSNGTHYLKDFVDVICKNSGGNGAIREMIEYIVKKDNIEQEFINSWL
ncbi:3-deoxy-D-manno-octulosonate 8-phosphate phosphatase [Malaciobacter canalis]|jgi:3-deoxy-D-manno-octulosonate 8-phosphate phosphatase (KDO 8-P phosphatase)|uniref:3-deoxy-D-manno-octulosonate 8-phosphate phosphatase n=1 Tax=Malaciobacter canalis TaxID=1912871 RepID=A0ABX4LT49_9BACT|nr:MULTISPECIES: HAD-IIIA family hydrolase [Malaciobacter]PHO11067.1 3-deoxy-D-manno-octulosonate 8-phosphate phosphatase [Malaciobacter canalis]QEE33147.1 3-deoxy-D-manno-octulosonate 8-phosphate phosphatase, YrbI family [Malaciobacter canalis]SKB67028.1 3-deoxy-D-manno-octulosonate 8-phosphate phosphatase (KDO 8-P phosphatase) [Malaciobacter marinus]